MGPCFRRDDGKIAPTPSAPPSRGRWPWQNPSGPANFVFRTPITLPMSFMPAAPVSAIAAEIAALTSSSDICFGRYAEMIAISSRSCAASSARPPLS